MRIVVIGGTQFMGREATLRLADRGHDVTVMHRTKSHDLGPDIGNLVADRGDVDAVARLMRDNDFEVVLDFAYDWERGTTAEQVEGLARACPKSLHRYVFMSSVAAYGEGIGLSEDAPLASADHPNPYVVNKAATELALFRMHEETGFPVTTFRPPFVHGPRQPFYREQFFWDRMRDGRPIILPDGGDTPMQWVFAPDVAEVCARAIEVPAAAGEAFNIAHAEATTQRSFVEALADVADMEPRLVSIPRDAILGAGGEIMGRNLYFGEYLDLPPITTMTDKVSRVLDFTSTPLDTALWASWEWYLSQPRRPVDYSFEDQLLINA
jgi:2'-hydroxyisoflavone reductase